MDGLLGPPGECGDGAGPCQLVGERGQRQARARHAGDLGAPDAGAAHDDVGGDLAVVRDDGGDAVGSGGVIGFGTDVQDLVAVEDAYAAGTGVPELRLDGEHRLGQAVGGDQQSAEDAVAVDERVQGRAFVRAHEPALDAPGSEPAVAAVQVGEAFGGGGEFESADREEAGLPVDVEGGELLDGVAGQFGHGLRGVRLEHEARGVGGGAAGDGERALVGHRDPGPAAQGQFVRQRRAHDARSDDDHARSRHLRPSDSKEVELQFPYSRRAVVEQLPSAQRGAGCATHSAARPGWCQERRSAPQLPCAQGGNSRARRAAGAAFRARCGARERGPDQPFFPSQASTFARLAPTHFAAASSGDILSCAMYFATRFWSSFDQLKFFTSR